ncbi:efflux RND transporter periplasmic adaptor subunit [Ahrensia marina]|uniref:efflux RND transporter periplasmic adaptor subunit n=1 Tax=Ahrensia marina TaxID=1514904 RepID=UPI0035D0BFF6
MLASLIPATVLAQDDTSTVPSAPRPAMVFEVASSPDTYQRTYPGIVRPEQEAELSFRVSGRMIALPVRASDFVSEGDIIAQLDPRDFEAQIALLESQVDQATAQLTALRSGARTEEIAALEAAVDAALAQVEQAQDQVSRSASLAGRGVVSQARLDQDQAALRVAQAQLRTNEEQLTIGLTGGRAEDVEAAEAALRGLQAQLQNARDNLGDTTLRAPFDGYVAQRALDNFTNVQAGQVVVSLQELSTVRLAFDVPSSDVTTFAVAQDIDISVSFDAAPDSQFAGELVEFAVDADSTTQTYRGQVSVNVPEEAPIFPGMVGRISASTAIETNSLLVPLTAIASTSDGSPFVWSVNETTNAVSQVAVTLGAIDGDMVAITDGLTPGDTVVRAGVSRLMDGMSIRPITRVGG